jgi:sulfur transfer protein SufE
MKCQCDVPGCENKVWVDLDNDDLVVVRNTPDNAKFYAETRVTLPHGVALAVYNAFNRQTTPEATP